MKPTRTPEPAGTGLMWIWIGVAVMIAGALTLLRLGGNVSRVVVGAALIMCLGMVAVMLWLARRADGETKRPAGRR